MDKEKMVPELRFGEFEGEWTNVKLGNICNFKQGVQVDLGIQLKKPKKDYIKFLRIENYTQKSQDFRYIPKHIGEGKVINDDEIAIVRYGATAGFISRGLNGVLANNLFKISPLERMMSNEFLYRLLTLYKSFKYFQSEMAGGAMPALSFGIVKSLKISFPDLLEQQKIANFLTAIDQRITLLKQKKAALEQYKKGLMQKIFNQEIRFKDDEGNDFPDWEEKRLGDVCNLQMGTSPKSSAYNNVGNGLPLIQGNADIKSRRSAPRVFTTEITKECYPNDLILSVRAPVGEISKSNHHACIGRGVSAISSKNGTIIEFVFQYLLWFEPRWKSISQGSTFESVNSKDISGLKLKIPCLKEQQKIANFLSATDKKITAMDKQIKETEAFKKGLLQRMFV